MPPKRSVSSRGSATDGGDRPIQTTTNTLGKLEMQNAGDATEAKLNVAGGNTKASAVTVSDGTPKKATHGAFQPGTTPVKFGKAKGPAKRSPPPPKRGFSLRRLALQLTALYALIAYFFICPTDPSRAPAVCQSFKDLEGYRNQAVSYIKPVYQPYVDHARTVAQPYYEPYVKASRPHVERAQKVLRPQAVKARANFDRHVKPRLLDAVTHSHKRFRPHADRLSREYSRLTDPYVKRYSTLATEFYDLNVKPTYDELVKEGRKVVMPLYRQSTAYVQPFVRKAYPATQHHLKHTVLPFASSSYATSRKIYGEQVHPLVMSGGKGLLEFVRIRLVPALGRFRSRYISPQLNKIQDRAFAYKAKSVAKEKVANLDAELGKDVIDDEIEELLSDIKAHTTTFASTLSATEAAEPRPTAVDTVEFNERDDALAQKVLEDEALARQKAEKRKAIEALHDLYEVEIAKLGETEMKLLADRLTQLRKAALRDIPNRFDIAIQGYKEECDKWVGRLDKYWEKASRDERSSKEDKIADGVLIARKASVKLADQAEELEDEIDAYLRTHSVREVTSAEKAFKTVEAFVGKAQHELGGGYAYLDDVTHADWARYHTLAALEGQWHHQLFGLRNGSVTHRALDQSLAVDPVLAKLKRELERLSADVDARLTASRKKGELKINGQFAGVTDAAQRGYAAVQDAVAAGTEKIAGAVSSASVAVAGEPAPTDLSGSASSLYTEAVSTASSVYGDTAASASSLASEVSASMDSAYSAVSASVTSAASAASALVIPSNLEKALADATNGLGRGYAAASKSLLNLAGIQPSPTNAQQSASSVLAQASLYLFEAQDAAVSLFASYASEASKTAASLAGQTAAPTNLPGSASSLAVEASSSAFAYADSMASAVSSAAVNAEGIFVKIARDAYEALPTLPSTDDLPAYAEVTSTLSAQLHQATREAAKAVGISVTPESFAEHTESLLSQASSVASSVSASLASAMPEVPNGQDAVDAASSSIHEATRAVMRAVGATPSPESPAEYAQAASAAVSSSLSSLASVASDSLPSVAIPAASDLSSAYHEATRSAASALGAQPTPEKLVDSASSVVNAATRSVESLASQASTALRDAARAAQRAAGGIPSAEGVVGSVQSAASQAASAVSSAAGSVREHLEL